MLILSKPEQIRIVLREARDGEPEAFVLLEPITGKMRRRALRASRRMLEDAGISDTTDLDGDTLGDIGEEVSRALIRMGVTAWGGVGDEAGKPIPLTPDRETRVRTANDPDRPTGTIDLLLGDEAIFDRLDSDYVRPDAIRRAEKNGLSGSPNGISAEATPGKDTASSAARPKRRADAPNARTRSTRSEPKRANGSGRS